MVIIVVAGGGIGVEVRAFVLSAIDEEAKNDDSIFTNGILFLKISESIQQMFISKTSR